MCHSRSAFVLAAVLGLAASFVVSDLQAAEVGGTTISTNTTLTDGDTWNAGNLGINNGAVVNIPAGATLHFTPAANRNLTSNTTGTLQIDATGIFSHATATSGDNLIVSGAVAILNNGTYDFASGGDLQLVNNGSSFTNAGLLLKSAGAVGGSNDPSYLFPASASSGGTFSNTGNITVNAGHLSIAGGSSTAGTFTTASGATLSFSGRWTGLTGVSDTSAGGTILISNENPVSTTGGQFTADAATTVLNVTGSGLRLGSSAYTAITLNLNGNTLRNDGLLLLSTGTTTVTGAGSFENGSTGTFQMTGGALALNGGDLTNNGSMTVTTGTTTLGGTASVINGATGTLAVNASGVLTVNTMLTNNGQATFSGTSTLTGGGALTNNSQMSISGTSTLSGTVVVTNAAAGTLTLGGGASTLTLNGNNLINNGTASYSSADGNVTLAGSGKFINNGTFNHVFGGTNDNFIITGTVTFENNGTFDFQERGDIQTTSSGVFENKGLVVKSVAGTDPSFIFRDATGSVSNIIAAAGSELRSNAGVLHVASGGTSDAAALWTADGGHLGIAGQWTGTITGSSANAGRVRVSASGNGGVASNLLIGAGGLVVDVSGDGMFWDQSIINTQGNTLTNVDTFTISGSGTKTLAGGGEFLNAAGATLTHLEGTITFADGSILRNQGNMIISLGAVTSGYAGTGSFINDTTGSVDWTGGSITVTAPAEFHNQGTLNISGTSTHTLAGDGLFSNDAAGVINWTGSATISISGTLTNNGTFNAENDFNRLFAGAGSFINNGTLNHNIASNSADNIGWSGTGQFINNGVFAFNDNNDYQMEGGTLFTNSATGIIRLSTTDNEEAQFFSFSSVTGSGTLDNQGTVEVLGGKFRVTTALAGGTFHDIALTQNDNAGTLTGGAWVADSSLTGTASIDLQPFGPSSGITTIGSAAVVELTGANATLVQLSSLAQVDGGFFVNQKTFTPTGTLTVGATGSLGGNGTIAGDVLVSGAVLPGSARGADVGTLDITGNLTFNSGSQVTLQLSAPLGVENSVFVPAQTLALIDALPDLDSATQHDAVEVTGILTLDTAMTIHVIDAGNTYAYGQYFDLFDFASLSGISSQAEADDILNLPDIGSFVWDTSLFVSKGIIVVVPEPSRAMLWMIGCAATLLRRRRHA